MTDKQRRLCGALVGVGPLIALAKNSLMRNFPEALEGGKLSNALLNQTKLDRDDHDLECALLVGFKFGFDSRSADTLIELLDDNWHHSHEDIVSVLDKMRTPKAIQSFRKMISWVPEYLEFDKARALAVKAIWALGKLENFDADAVLIEAAKNGNGIIRENAVMQLKRRGFSADRIAQIS